MTVKKSISVTMVGLMLGAVLPQSVRAGDKEWATAGKILTGLAVFGALTSIAQPQPEPYYVEQRTVYVQQPVYMYAPPPVVYAPTAYAPQPYPQAQSSGQVPPPVPYQEAPVVQQQYVQPQQQQYIQQQPYVETPTVVYETRYFQGRRMERCPRVVFRNRRYQPREIVIPYGAGTRLYQPGIRGHITYVQQWAPHQRAWVTVGNHPCMW